MKANSIITQFFGIDGIEKITVQNSGNVYKKEAFNAFMIQQFPQYVENGVIPMSKYESVSKKARKQLRLLLLQILEMFSKQSTKEAKEKFAVQFAKFYATYYNVNDYSVESVTNGKMKGESMQLIASVLPKINNVLLSMKEAKEAKKAK